MAPKRKQAAKPVSRKRAKVEKVEEPVVEVDPVATKIEAVVAAITEHYEGDHRIKDLLALAASRTYEDVKEDRHRFFETFHHMVDETLLTFVETHKKLKEGSQAKLDNMDVVKEENEKTASVLGEKIGEKKTAIEAQKAEITEKEAIVASTSEALLEKTEAAAVACAEKEKMEQDVVKTTEVQLSYKQLLDRSEEAEILSAKDKKKMILTVVSFLKKVGAASSLTVALPGILAKEEHGSFDDMVIAEASRMFEERIAGLNASIAEEKAKTTPLVAAREAASGSEIAAKEDLRTHEESLEVLEQALQELVSEKKAVEKKLKNHDKEGKKIADELAAHTSTFDKLTEIYAHQQELYNRTNIVVATEEEQAPTEEEVVVVPTAETEEHTVAPIAENEDVLMEEEKKCEDVEEEITDEEMMDN